MTAALVNAGAYGVVWLLSTAFTLARLVLYVFSVTIAWQLIVEQSPPYTSSYEKLTSAALKSHHAQQHLQSDSESEYSYEDDDARSEAGDGPREESGVAPATPGARAALEARPAPAALVPALPHHVGVERLHAHVPGAPAAGGARGAKQHKRKKPVLNRLIERHVWASARDTSGQSVGHVVYAGISKMARVTERNVLDSAIREAGVEAARVAEHEILRKYLKFIVVWLVLTVVLVPMPGGVVSVNVTLGSGGRVV
eukprot:scaffold20.g7738.t1